MRIEEKLTQKLFEPANITINGHEAWDIQVHNPKFYRRVLLEGSLGFGESFMDEWWSCGDLYQVLVRVLSSGIRDRADRNIAQVIQEFASRLINRQSLKRARAVAERHYDIGNELYDLMLDSQLTYSCAYWGKGAETLEQAQLDKLDLLCQKLQLAAGMNVLDIGSGWGSFLNFAARNYGITGIGITLSANQAEWANTQAEKLPVSYKVEDYRHHEGFYDRVISIGMFEHVGYRNYRTFMKCVDRLLREDGIFVLQSIGSNITNHSNDPWFHKYIYPNSMTPSTRQIAKAVEGLFLVEDWHNLGLDYHRTIFEWYKNFQNAWQRLSEEFPKYDAKFKRMWDFYLTACAANFKARKILPWQIVFTKDKPIDIYSSSTFRYGL